MTPRKLADTVLKRGDCGGHGTSLYSNSVFYRPFHFSSGCQRSDNPDPRAEIARGSQNGLTSPSDLHNRQARAQHDAMFNSQEPAGAWDERLKSSCLSWKADGKP